MSLTISFTKPHQLRWVKRLRCWLPWEGVPGVVHDAVEIIRLPKRVDLPRLHFEEVILLTWEQHIYQDTPLQECEHSFMAWFSFIILQKKISRGTHTKNLHILKFWYFRGNFYNLFLWVSKYKCRSGLDALLCNLIKHLSAWAVAQRRVWEEKRHEVTSQSLKDSFTLKQGRTRVWMLQKINHTHI